MLDIVFAGPAECPSPSQLVADWQLGGDPDRPLRPTIFLAREAYLSLLQSKGLRFAGLCLASGSRS